MADDVLLNKAAAIERCVARAREEYRDEFTAFTRQILLKDIPNDQP